MLQYAKEAKLCHAFERNKLAFEVSPLHHLLQFTLARLLARDCSCVFLCVKMQYSIFVRV